MKARIRMCGSEFLKRWIKGLHICRSFQNDTNILDRKTAIKLSADVAIASTRKATTRWSQALMCDVVSRDGISNRILVERISGRKVDKRALITCSSRLIRHKARRRRVVPKCIKSSTSIARKLVKNRTRVLKKLVPGGEEMDDISLIRETLDYIVSLQVQVDVMRRLAAAAERLEPPSTNNILICN